MWRRISLRARIISIWCMLLAIILGGGLIMIWYTYQLESQFDLVEDDMIRLHSIDDLLMNLVNQKGLVSFYYIDSNNNPRWLEELEEYRYRFKRNLEQVKKNTFSESNKNIINKIETEYEDYSEHKDEIIQQFQNHEKEASVRLILHIRDHFSNIKEMCENYKNIYIEKMNQNRTMRRSEARHLRFIAVMALFIAIGFGVILAVILIIQILEPLRRLAEDIDQSKHTEKGGDEVVILKHRVNDLIKDMEKFAVVGKLAAGAAHSIRNPLTSVKMRLFSMKKSLLLSPEQKADFDVISREIRHINNVIQNFLEFSRPPSLKKKKISLSDAVDAAIQLLKNRLEAYNVQITVKRHKRLPELLADSDQIREVFVNLIMNACEAMKKGGSITIEEEEKYEAHVGRILIIRFIDDGPGIPPSIQEKIFQPFFTCKEEGTGLGLTIAERIINEHGGWLDIESGEGKGATFIITLPVKKD
ncbi:MAG: ATP-binding protein [bacterium]